MQNIRLNISLLPFHNNFRSMIVNDYDTLDDIINKTVPYNIEGCRLVATVNNEITTGKYKLKENDIVGLNFIPTGGGGGGGKNGVQILVTLAIIAATVYTAGAAGAAIGAAYGTAAGAVAQGAVLVAGSMINTLVNQALFSVPGQSKADKNKGFYNIGGTSNAIDKYGIVPANLGVNRMYPNQAALPFTEMVGDDSYCRQLFTYGYGDIKISERKFGETKITEFKDFVFEDMLESNLNKGTSIYTNDVFQENMSVTLKYNETTIRTTQKDTEECEINIIFPYGLYIIYGKNNNKYSKSGVEFLISYSISGSNKWTDELVTFVDLRKTTFVKVKTIKFPVKGQYDVRIKRISENGNHTDDFKDTTLTVLKSIKHIKPVNLANISGSALRIKATDQLNGTIDSYNCIVSTLVKSYNPSKKQWIDGVVSSNPADIFRYVLQSKAFAKRMPDNKIDLEKLEEWWIYCDKEKLTYNRIINYDTSVDDVLNDICSAGVATLSKVNNIYSVIIDNERPIIKGLITPRNSWNYKGNINYPELPHALRVEFRNSLKGYETDERIVYAEGYNEQNAELYERLQFESCTDSTLAYWYGKRYFATALLQPETHTFQMDFENFTFGRGDRIQLVNDVILVGVGQGRIKELIVDDVDNPQFVRGFTIDDEVTIPTTNKFGVRIRDKSFDYHMLKTSTGPLNEFMFEKEIEYSKRPSIGSLCAFVEDGKELDIIITGIKPSSDSSATITAINYAPERFKPLKEIPPFESNITIPLDFYKPLSPLLNGDIKSDESVMLKNSDGSIISTMVVPLLNRNENTVSVSVKCRITGGETWFIPSILKKEPNELILTGLDDGIFYDIDVRYQRTYGLQLISNPLVINNIMFVGGSTLPNDVKDFKVSILNGMGLFTWLPNSDIDISHYIIKYNSEVEGADWLNSQIFADNIKNNNITGIIHKGVYFIKAVDFLKNESANTSAIISTDEGAYKNVVEVLTQQPQWFGQKEDVVSFDNTLTLASEKNQGYYYFNPDPFDLGEVYDCSLTSVITSKVVDRFAVRDISKIRDVETIRDFGFSNKIRTVDKIRDLNDVRTFTGYEWYTSLEMKLSNDNIVWTDWVSFTASQHTFRYCKFRLKLYTESEMFKPVVSKTSVTIDMPDRFEKGEDIEILNAVEGINITYSNTFRNNPSVNITLQDASTDDKIEFIEKNNKGFTIRIFNNTINGYVTRSFDYLTAGYGKVV